MKVLIVVASKHGSTHEIAEAIGAEIRSRGHEADVFDVAAAPEVEGYGAAVIGSAIYAGSWMEEPRQYVKAREAALARIPVWLFSSGPLGDKPAEDPAQLPELMQMTGARGHHVLEGKLDKADLGLGERLIVKLVKAPYGDFRDWEDIRGWADEIAAALDAS